MNGTDHRTISRAGKYAAALWAAAFLFFLLYSAPHQVHHVFERLPQPHHHDADHDHSKSDPQGGPSADSNCVFQVAASRCHLGLAWHVAPVLLPSLTGIPIAFHSTNRSSTNHAVAFQIRAPPLA
jgi:hypothetical protein